MNSMEKLWATLIVWGSFTTITLATILGLVITLPAVPVEAIVLGLLGLGGIAGFSTSVIWRGNKLKPADQEKQLEKVEQEMLPGAKE